MENDKNTPPASIRKKTACAECRQQKMRCQGDPSEFDPPACSRCRRLNISCVFSAPFKRTHKRKRLLELEEETSALKRQLLASSPQAPSNPIRPRDLTPPSREDAVRVSQTPTASLMTRSQLHNVEGPTISRAIEGVELAPNIIDDCFESYFKNFHPLLPLLSTDFNPNTFYQHAPFLFWVIISIGSRKYPRQPTLTQALAAPVTQLALQSVLIRTRPIERIKALILLLNWPFPSGPFYNDPTFLLAGILLHMAMQCGLHAPSSSQEFSKTSLRLPEQDPLRKAEIWAYVVIIYQRTCSGSAQATLPSFETYNDQTQFTSLAATLPESIRIQLQVSNIIARTNKAVLDLGLQSMTPQQERAMDALLNGFNAELDSLEKLASIVWDRLHISCARQELIALHFYKSAATLDMQTSLLIFNTMTSFLEQIRDIDRDYGLSNMATRYHMAITTLSVSCLGRILRGPFGGYLDQTRGYSVFQAGVRFMRSASVQKLDYGERAAEVVEKLWKSTKVFRNPDGSINIALRVRNRLSGGALHDAIRCWREEFFGPDYTYSAPAMDAEPDIMSRSAAPLDTLPVPPSITDVALPNFSTVPDFGLNDDLWGDFGVGLTDNWDLTGSVIDW